jgi:hypothetical protein
MLTNSVLAVNLASLKKPEEASARRNPYFRYQRLDDAANQPQTGFPSTVRNRMHWRVAAGIARPLVPRRRSGLVRILEEHNRGSQWEVFNAE